MARELGMGMESRDFGSRTSSGWVADYLMNIRGSG